MTVSARRSAGVPPAEQTPSRRRFLRLPLVFAAVVALLGMWAFWWEPRRLVFRETSMPLACWTGAPIRIAVVSDLHVGAPYVGTDTLSRLVRLTNAQKPDMVVLLGDFVIQGVIGGRFVSPEQIATILEGLRAPLGVHAVMGNHDRWLDATRVERAFAAAGIEMLEDRAVRVRRNGGELWIVGISDYITAAHDVRRAMSQVKGTAPIIAITHNPDVFPSIPRRVCLTLAGHTHGGQVALPFIGRPIVPSHYGEHYAIGPVHEGGKDLLVTAGVGTSIIPVRFRVPPEVVLVTIRAPDTHAGRAVPRASQENDGTGSDEDIRVRPAGGNPKWERRQRDVVVLTPVRRALPARPSRDTRLRSRAF